MVQLSGGSAYIEIVAPGFNKVNTLQTFNSFAIEESLNSCTMFSISLREPLTWRYRTFTTRGGEVGTTFQMRWGMEPGLKSPFYKFELLESRREEQRDTDRWLYRGLCHGNVLNRTRFSGLSWSNKRKCKWKRICSSCSRNSKISRKK